MLPRPARLAALPGALALFCCVLSRPAGAQEAPELPPHPAPAKKPDLPPPAARTNLLLTGLGVTTAWYAGAVGTSLLWQNGRWAPDVRIPIVGPWMAMPHLGCGKGELSCSTALVVIRGILAGMDGVGQAGGLAIALESLFLPVQASARASRRARAPRHAWVRPVPFVAGRDGVGLGFVGEM